MASTYTANSGIEKIGAGEQAGTWGTTTNNNLDILDRAINGIGAITLTGTTHTLTTSDGTLSDGGYKVLVLGGSPSGTNTITISPNDQDKVYIVQNGTNQTATFTQGSGANVSVAAGSKKIIYADGAGSGAAVIDVTDALDIASLRLGGTAITSTAAELNKLDGVNSTTTELNIVERYYAVVAHGASSQDGTSHPVSMGAMYNSSTLYSNLELPCDMRTTPTLEIVSATGYYTFYRNGGSDVVDDFALTKWGTRVLEFYNNSDISGTAGHAGFIRTSNSAAKFAVTAEL